MALQIDRQSPAEAADFKGVYTVGAGRGGAIALRVRFTELTLDGQNRTGDLTKILGNQVAQLGWDDQSRRSGAMRGFNMRPGDPHVMTFMGELGIYLCEFPNNAVAPGDLWQGATTATGGCTNGTYTLVGYRTLGGKEVAVVQVKDIEFLQGDRQVGPMVMIVDTNTGLPQKVEYTTVNPGSGRRSHFVQTLLSSP